MRKHLHIAIFILILGVSSLFAQTLTLSVDTLIKSEVTEKYDVTAHSTVTNNSDKMLTLNWYRIVNNLPGSWNSAICDNNRCWATNINVRSFTLDAGQSGTMDMHFYPGGNPGNGQIEVVVYDPTDSASTVVKGVYIAKVEQATASPGISNGDQIKIYPNPVNNYILIKNIPSQKITRVEIFNILGTKMLSYKYDPLNAINRFDVQQLPKGVYMVRLYDAYNNVLLTRTISKR